MVWSGVKYRQERKRRRRHAFQSCCPSDGCYPDNWHRCFCLSARDTWAFKQGYRQIIRMLSLTGLTCKHPLQQKKNKKGGGKNASLHGENSKLSGWFCRAVVEARADSIGLCLSCRRYTNVSAYMEMRLFRGRHTHAGVWGRWAGGLLKDLIALSAVLEWQATGRGGF